MADIYEKNAALADFLVFTGLPIGVFYGWNELSRPVILDGRWVQLYQAGNDGVCVDLTTGEVAMLFGGKGRIGHINRSIEDFSKIVELVMEKYPVFSQTSDMSTLEVLVSELDTKILEIDDSCIRGTYWATFLDDLLMGIYFEGDED